MENTAPVLVSVPVVTDVSSMLDPSLKPSVTIHLDYSKNSHILTGLALKDTYEKFRLEVLREATSSTGVRWASWHARLTKDPEIPKGWTIKKENLDDLERALKLAEIPYEKKTCAPSSPLKRKPRYQKVTPHVVQGKSKGKAKVGKPATAKVATSQTQESKSIVTKAENNPDSGRDSRKYVVPVSHLSFIDLEEKPSDSSEESGSDEDSSKSDVGSGTETIHNGSLSELPEKVSGPEISQTESGTGASKVPMAIGFQDYESEATPDSLSVETTVFTTSYPRTDVDRFMQDTGVTQLTEVVTWLYKAGGNVADAEAMYEKDRVFGMYK
jgi:hypothetical protein